MLAILLAMPPSDFYTPPSTGGGSPSIVPPPAAPPGAWPPARRLAMTIVRPITRFLHIQAASGIVLLVMAVVALVWANSPWGASYEHLWHAPVSIGAFGFEARHPLHFWINDGLMAIFFFVVGLEIRREIHEGELSDLKRATLPIAAALGGMAVPAILYTAWNPAMPAHRGWGVPMATDIAFAVGALALLGKRVPSALRVLLLALAIIDDIGAIIVIAIFYSSTFDVTGLAVVAAGVAAVLGMQRIGVRHPMLYAAPGLVVWAGMLRTGVHPTIAGVILGLLTPARPWFGSEGFLAVAHEAIDEIGRAQRAGAGAGAKELVAPLERLAEAGREALPPVVRLENILHPWVAFGIMPLFALANAGIRIDGIDLGAPELRRIAAGVALGLVLGKPIGVMLASWIAVRLGLAALPGAVSWRGVLLVGLVAGIGFTMAIFVAGLAFDTAPRLGAAKLAVLVASATSAALALGAGRLLLLSSAPPSERCATTPDEAEQSTEY